MQIGLRVTLIALFLMVQGNLGSLPAQPLHVDFVTPSVATAQPASSAESKGEGSVHLVAENSARPSEREALTCFTFALSHLRFYEAVANVCRIPLPERLADFVRRGVTIGEGRFERLYGAEARSRLRGEVDQSLARVDAEALGISCPDARLKLAATEEALFSTPEGERQMSSLLWRLGNMMGRPMPNSFDCE